MRQRRPAALRPVPGRATPTPSMRPIPETAPALLRAAQAAGKSRTAPGTAARRAAEGRGGSLLGPVALEARLVAKEGAVDVQFLALGAHHRRRLAAPRRAAHEGGIRCGSCHWQAFAVATRVGKGARGRATTGLDLLGLPSASSALGRDCSGRREGEAARPVAIQQAPAEPPDAIDPLAGSPATTAKAASASEHNGARSQPGSRTGVFRPAALRGSSFRLPWGRGGEGSSRKQQLRRQRGHLLLHPAARPTQERRAHGRPATR